MKTLRTVLLPLLLCAVILAANLCAPELYRHFAPDYKNEIRTVPLADTESPLYLEPDSGLALPVWQHVQESKSGPASDREAGPACAAFAAEQVAAQIALPAETETPRFTDASLAAARYDAATGSLYLKDGEAAAGDKTYTVDFASLYPGAFSVLENYRFTCSFPYFLHWRETGRDAVPAADPEALRRTFLHLLDILREHLSADAAHYDVDALADFYVSRYGSETAEDAKALLRFVAALLFPENYPVLEGGLSAPFPPEYYGEMLLASLLSVDSIYTAEYEGETLLFLSSRTPSDGISVLFYDGGLRRVTGYDFTEPFLELVGLDRPDQTDFSIPAEEVELPDVFSEESRLE